jgi:hypothetical protein
MAGLPFLALIPNNTPLCWTSSCASWLIVVPDTLYTFVRVNIINLFPSWVFTIIYNCFYWTFVDASSAIDASISDFYGHFRSFHLEILGFGPIAVIKPEKV